jgi:hypothetical protein
MLRPWKFYDNPVTWGLKARSLQPAETAAVSERPCKRHVTARYRGDRGIATIKELCEEVFPVRSAPRLYNWSSFEPVPPGSMRRKFTSSSCSDCRTEYSRYWKPWHTSTGPRNARGFQNSLRVRLLTRICRAQKKVILKNVNTNLRHRYHA